VSFNIQLRKILESKKEEQSLFECFKKRGLFYEFSEENTNEEDD